LNNDPLQNIFDRLDVTKNMSDADLETIMPTERLLERLNNELNRKPVGWFRRKILRRTVVITATTVLVLAGSAAAISLLRGPVRDVTRLSCFAKISLTSGADVITYTSNPLSACQSFMHWPLVPSGSSPNGSLCVLSNGSLAAFPPSRKDQVCADLGLAVFDGHIANLKVAAFEESTQNYFTAHPCMSPSVAREEVQRLLTKYDLTGWHVTVTGKQSTNACATLSIQVSLRLVDIVEFVIG